MKQKLRLEDILEQARVIATTNDCLENCVECHFLDMCGPNEYLTVVKSEAKKVYNKVLREDKLKRILK